MNCEWPDKIFSVNSDGFPSLALEIFRYQYQHNPVYKAFVDTLKIKPSNVNSLENIPFLPIIFFKSHEIKTGEFSPEQIFESSGTTGSKRSRHFVKDQSLYTKSFIQSFEKDFGPVNEWCVIGLLPSYLERNTSSLVFMVNELIKRSGNPQSGFYFNEFEKLKDTLEELEKRKQKTILIGVTFALLDLAENFSMTLCYTIIMETGGMKGRREEITRTEVHEILMKAFAKNEIHSEYGMTELLSQTYSKVSGLFHCPPWMKIFVRDEEDPFIVSAPRFQTMVPLTGAINIIDLTNVHSCSFVATDDIGRLYADGSFEVLGRMDGSDLRGCSLLSL